MPIDPKTGERLPYPGEPGYKEEGGGAANPEEVTEKDVDDLLQRISAAEEGAPPEEGAPVEAAPGEGAPPEEGAPEEGEGEQDLSPLIETLGVTPERAEMLYQAAQQLASTQGKSPDDLAAMIADDFDILMQLEVIAARSMQNQPEPPAPPPGAGAPDAAGMPPEMMPPGGM